MKTDASSATDVDNLKQATLAKFGHVDALYNNAGILVTGKIEETKEADWDRLMAVNVKSVYLMTRAFVPLMINQHHGAIINTSSISGIAGDYGMALYDASKGAITNLTRAMALDYGKDNVRVNAVAPGNTETPMLTQGLTGALDPFIAKSPMHKLVQPKDIGEAAFFLASDNASAINGVILPVTTGIEIHTGQPTDNL